jgi:hypothetical protein
MLPSENASFFKFIPNAFANPIAYKWLNLYAGPEDVD